jgi:exodeoxyribonuclease VII small subunit
MENAELPLEKLLASYEEGMRLVKACGDRLTDAEQKVEILSRAVEPVQGASSAEPGETANPAAGSDIRLF